MMRLFIPTTRKSAPTTRLPDHLIYYSVLIGEFDVSFLVYYNTSFD